MDVPPPGKAVLSMSGLSHSVIRVDTEEKLSVLTVQDVGQVMPGGIIHHELYQHFIVLLHITGHDTTLIKIFYLNIFLI